MSEWIANPGHPPKSPANRNKALMVRWSTGKVEGPLAPKQWRMMNWGADVPVQIEAVMFVDGRA